MSSSNVPIITGAPTLVGDLLEEGWSVANGRAGSAFDMASRFVYTLGAVNIPFTSVASGFTAPPIGYTLVLPKVPASPDVTFPDLVPLDPLTLTAIPTVVPGAAPGFNVAPPVLQLLDRPAALVATAPGAAPTVADVTLPAAPSIVLPTDPLMQLISIPLAPTLNLPVWAGVAPDSSSLTAPSTGFVWSEDYYDSQLLQDTTGRLTTMLLGGTGLPAAIEQAIWDRGRAREDVVSNKATQEAYEEFSARGFMLPPGALAGRLAEVGQRNREATSTFSRDVAIKQAELEVENLKFAVSNGIQLSGTLMTYAGQYAQRALEAAKTVVEAAINIFNAQVALFNSRLQAYQTEASVFKELIQAESLRLDQYRTEIEAQKLIGDINVQAIQIYSERIKALLSSVELYKAQLDGVKTGVDIDRVRIEGFRATVDAYKALIDAKSSEYQAWGESIRGEVSKVSVYESQARAFGTLVDAYKTGEMVKVENLRGAISASELEVKAFGAKVDYLSEQIKAGIAQVDTGVRIYDGQARVYGAQISGEQARVQALAEQTRLIIAGGTADAELNLKAADINIQQVVEIGKVASAARSAAGQIAGQLAASAMGAFNLSASASNGFNASMSSSRSDSHQF